MPAIETLHERLDREHTEALLKNYSADYEIWLEDRVAQLEDELRIEKQKHLDTSNWATEQQERADRLAAKLGGG